MSEKQLLIYAERDCAYKTIATKEEFFGGALNYL